MKDILILGISASPRRNGNSDRLLDEALAGAASAGAMTRTIMLRDLAIAPCASEEYDTTSENGLSVIKDDIYDVYDDIAVCDGIILVSPIFFGTVSAQCKAMIDRFHSVWLWQNKTGKRVFSRVVSGSFIGVQAADREDFFLNAEAVARNFFATVGLSYEGGLNCPGLERADAAAGDKGALEQARSLGRAVTRAVLTKDA